MYARADFIDRNPQTIQAFAYAMVRALVWIDQATAENIADVLPAEWAVPNRDLFLASIRGTRDMFSPDGKFSLDGAKVEREDQPRSHIHQCVRGQSPRNNCPKNSPMMWVW